MIDVCTRFGTGRVHESCPSTRVEGSSPRSKLNNNECRRCSPNDADGRPADGWYADGHGHADGWHADGWHADGWHADGWHADGRHADGRHADGRYADADGHRQRDACAHDERSCAHAHAPAVPAAGEHPALCGRGPPADRPGADPGPDYADHQRDPDHLRVQAGDHQGPQDRVRGGRDHIPGPCHGDQDTDPAAPQDRDGGAGHHRAGPPHYHGAQDDPGSPDGSDYADRDRPEDCRVLPPPDDPGPRSERVPGPCPDHQHSNPAGDDPVDADADDDADADAAADDGHHAVAALRLQHGHAAAGPLRHQHRLRRAQLRRAQLRRSHDQPCPDPERHRRHLGLNFSALEKPLE